MKVFVVILNWNGKDFILQCLESVGKLKITNYKLQIIVVDNASNDGSDKIIENFIFRTKKRNLILIKNKENFGFAKGNNVGIKYALKKGADYVLVLNPDTIVDRNLLVQLIKVAKRDPKIGILGPKIYFAPGYEFHKKRYKPKEKGKVIWYAGGFLDWNNVWAFHRGVDEVDKGQYDTLIQTGFVSGCCMLVKRKIFEKIGLFDEKYFLYLEDVDFCQRAQKLGFKIVFVPEAKIFHLNAGSSEVGGSLQDYYITRNRLLFGMRYAPFRAKMALLKESLKLLFWGRRWQKVGVKDFYLGNFNKGSFP